MSAIEKAPGKGILRTGYRVAGYVAAAIFASLAILALPLSCASMQDDRLVSVDDKTAADRLAGIEEAVVRLDAVAEDGKAAAIASARDRVTALEKLNVSDTVFQSRLAAWSGRLYLLTGKTGEASKRYETASKLLVADVPTVILGARLEKTPELAFDSVEKSLLVDPGDPRLLVERALYAERLGRYETAVAAFDAAFPQLPAYYRDTYKPVRDRAWNLRGTGSETDKTVAAILAKPSVTWQDAIAYVSLKGPLLDFATAGKTVSPSKLFPKLMESAVIPPTSTGLSPRASDSITRSDAAWFLWHALAERRADKGILTKYSKRWAALRDGPSPIPDVPIADRAFDSVMGCVESEIMALPDGKNFRPLDPVSGADFARMVDRASD